MKTLPIFNSLGPEATRRWRLLGLTTIVVLLGACSSLKPIADFGKNGSVVAGHPGVATDYQDSLNREHDYSGSPASNEEVAQRKADARRLQTAQNTLASYAKALGGLAADDIANYDKDIDALNKSIVSGKFATSAQTDLYATVAKLGASAVTEFYRRRKIETIIKTYNPAIQKASISLVKTVNAYMHGLEDEKKALQDTAGPAEQSTEQGFRAMFKVTERNELAKLAEKEDDAQGLIKGIQTFARGHQELANNVGKADIKATADIAKKYADALKGVIDKFHSS